MSTTQNKGRFGFMAFQAFGTKAIKSNGETEVLNCNAFKRIDGKN